MNKNSKIVIIINGVGGVGKDTLCMYAAETFPTKTVSSITPIKELATLGGWDGEKSHKGRQLLVDLKQVFIQYNDLPYRYILSEYESFLNDENTLLFVHIREPKEIEKVVNSIDTPCVTLLIYRHNCEKWNNDSDKGVDDYSYDATFEMCQDKNETKHKFLEFLDELVTSRLA